MFIDGTGLASSHVISHSRMPLQVRWKMEMRVDCNSSPVIFFTSTRCHDWQQQQQHKQKKMSSPPFTTRLSRIYFFEKKRKRNGSEKSLCMFMYTTTKVPVTSALLLLASKSFCLSISPLTISTSKPYATSTNSSNTTPPSLYVVVGEINVFVILIDLP